jgi:hypothetical protein
MLTIHQVTGEIAVGEWGGGCDLSRGCPFDRNQRS